MIFSLTTTKTGEPCVEMRDGKELIAKMYANASGSKIRIVLPELVNMKQTLICDEQHFIEFTRDKKGWLVR